MSIDASEGPQSTSSEEPKPARPNPYARIRLTHPNAGKPWSKTDDEELRRLFGAGNDIGDLALLFGRTPKGTRMRLQHLGVIAPAQTVPAA